MNDFFSMIFDNISEIIDKNEDEETPGNE